MVRKNSTLTPYSVALFAPPNGCGAFATELYQFHADRNIRPVRAGNLRRGRDSYTVWRFETEALAEEFMARFAGERVTPKT